MSPTGGETTMRGWRLLLGMCAVLLLVGCASTGKEMSELQRAQYAWSAAIRWGDFEGAWNLVDPEFREAHPLSDLQLERYRQVQISHYRDLASSPGKSEALREIEIGVVNRHTMAERTLRYTEQWRYDPATKTWWITGGLPDFWAGE
ncbi:hypothetical protein [Luteimonas sp. SDU101]|uniref:hypothetical protein n=2 Tax=unclassified Luteimonas TaxID=2629088 RepID=UPI003EB7B37C